MLVLEHDMRWCRNNLFAVRPAHSEAERFADWLAHSADQKPRQLREGVGQAAPTLSGVSSGD